MHFNRQLLLLAFTFAIDPAHSRPLTQQDGGAFTATTDVSASNFPTPAISLPEEPSTSSTASRLDLRRRNQHAQAMKRASTSSPGLVIPAFRSGTASQSGSIAPLVEVTPTTPVTTPAMSSPNALSVLESALPSSIRSALNANPTLFLSTFNQPSHTAASISPTFNPESLSSSSSLTQSSPSTTSPPSTLLPTSSSTSTSTSITTSPSTLTSSPTTTTTTSQAALVAPTTSPHPTPGSNPAHPIDNAEIAGIASGIGAAAVIGLLAGLYIWRRRRTGRPLFGPRGSQRSGASDGIYPKSAWLYDPPIPGFAGGANYHNNQQQHNRNRSASFSEAGSEAEQNLLPYPVPRSRPLSEEIDADLGMPSPSLRAMDMDGYGSGGMTMMGGGGMAARGGGGSRRVAGDRVSSPLLPRDVPDIVVESPGRRSTSPFGSGSPGGSPRWSAGGRLPRPMTSIGEDEWEK